MFVGYEDTLRPRSVRHAVRVFDRSGLGDDLQGLHVDNSDFVFSGHRCVDSAQFRNRQDAMNIGKAVEVRNNFSFLHVERHKLIGVHGGDIEPTVGGIETLIVEANREPYEEQPATERTEVRVLYSRTEVYFGITCHDSASNGPVATQLRRDVSQELDDYFEIVIDSRHDRRNAYVFQINPLGTQRDALITDELAGDTQDGDPGWDGVWTSEAKITQDGWTATVSIPFATLNFMQSRDVVWGLNLKRFIGRTNEEDLWSGWRRTLRRSQDQSSRGTAWDQ